MFHVHKKFDLHLQCIGVIVSYIKISFYLRCMGCTNTYHGINYCTASSRKRKHNKRNFDTLFWVCMITLPLAQPIIMIQFLVILGSLSHKNPPLNIDLPIIFILVIFFNITFSPSHPHKIDYRV